MLSDKLFTEVTSEESATVSGGGPISYLFYMLLAGTPASPGGAVVTGGEALAGWNILINAAQPVNGIPSI